MTLEDVVIYAGTVLCLWLVGVLTSMVMWRRHRIVLDFQARPGEQAGRDGTVPPAPARPRRWRQAMAHR